MLPAAHIKRVRIQSVPTSRHNELENAGERSKTQGTFLQRKTLAESCTEATYNSVLNVKVLDNAVRQKPSLIIFRISKKEMFQFRISLKNLRRILMVSNLIVLATMIMSYTAWSTVNEVKNAHKGYEPHPWIKEKIDPLLALSLPYLDRALFNFSNYLLAYYVVFGCAISFFFGGPTDILCVVLLSPVVIIISTALIATAGLVLYFRSIFFENEHHFDDPATRNHLPFALHKSLVGLHQLLDVYGIPFSVLAILSSVVQFGMAVLPWFVYDLPFQRMLDIEDLVIYDIETRQMKNYPRSLKEVKARTLDKDKKNEEEEEKKTEVRTDRQAYRSMSSARTVLLQLCKPELRQMHRNYY